MANAYDHKTYSQFTLPANEQLIPAYMGCACPGQNLIFTCTVINGRATIWGGSALDCPGNQDEIQLLHNRFSDPGAFGECNSGAIVGESVGIDGTCYTSQLNVTVSRGLHNKNVSCSESSTSQLIGISWIKVAGKTCMRPKPTTNNSP